MPSLQTASILPGPFETEMNLQAITAKLHAEVTYIPFKDADEAAEADQRDGSMAPAQAEKKLGGSFNRITDEDKGILTVTLTGCKNLEVRQLNPAGITL